MSIRSDFILSLDINVIIVISIILITKNGIYSESVYNNERFNDSQLITQCIARCPNQVKIIYFISLYCLILAMLFLYSFCDCYFFGI